MINRLRGAPLLWSNLAGPAATREAGVPFDTLVLNSSGRSPHSPSSVDPPASPLIASSFEKTPEHDADMLSTQQRVIESQGVVVDSDVHAFFAGFVSKAKGELVIEPIKNAVPPRPVHDLPLPPAPIAHDIETLLNHCGSHSPPLAAGLPIECVPERPSMELPYVERVVPHWDDVTLQQGDIQRTSVVGQDRPIATDSALQEEPVQPCAAPVDLLHFEVRNEDTDRTVETVTVPWQLLAHMMLSQQGQLVAPSAAIAALPVAIAGSAPTLGVPDAHPVSQVAMASTVTGLMPADHAAPAASTSLPSPMRTHISTEAVGADRPAANISAGAPWALRLIRWASEHTSESVVWLRDYTIDETTATGLMKMLQAFGHAHGVHVTKLMFNGRELWRAPHSGV